MDDVEIIKLYWQDDACDCKLKHSASFKLCSSSLLYLYLPCAGGAPPTDVTVEQTDVSTVLVMWTAPSPPPTDGYQVQITRGSTTTTVNVAGTSYTASLQHGVYSFQVKSLAQHFPSEATEPVEITVRSKQTLMGECLWEGSTMLGASFMKIFEYRKSTKFHSR